MHIMCILFLHSSAAGSSLCSLTFLPLTVQLERHGRLKHGDTFPL